MGCGGSTRAVVPHYVGSGVVPDSGFSSIVPESAPSTTGRAWEEADKAPNDARLPDRLKDAEEEEKKEEGRKQPAILRKEVEAIGLSAHDSGMRPQDQPETPRERLRWPFQPRADSRPQASLEGDDMQEGKIHEEDPSHAKRILTDRALSDVIKDKLDLILNENIVPEPIDLQNYNSFRYTPTKEHFAEGHPLAPCLPSHEGHVKKVRKAVTQFAKFPEKFKDLVDERRDTMKMQQIRQLFKAKA